jgi:hypothetical protein
VRRAFLIRQPLSDPSPFSSRHRTLDHAGALILIETVALARLTSRASCRLVRHRGGSCLGHAYFASGRTSAREGRVRQALI